MTILILLFTRDRVASSIANSRQPMMHAWQVVVFLEVPANNTDSKISIYITDFNLKYRFQFRVHLKYNLKYLKLKYTMLTESTVTDCDSASGPMGDFVVRHMKCVRGSGWQDARSLFSSCRAVGRERCVVMCQNINTQDTSLSMRIN